MSAIKLSLTLAERHSQMIRECYPNHSTICDYLDASLKLVKAMKSGDQVAINEAMGAWGDDDWDPIER